MNHRRVFCRRDTVGFAASDFEQLRRQVLVQPALRRTNLYNIPSVFAAQLRSGDLFLKMFRNILTGRPIGDID